MSQGFLAYNENGKVTAGSDLSNLYFLRKATVTVSAGGFTLPIVPPGGMIFFQTSLPLAIVSGVARLLSMGSYYQGWWSGGGFVSGTLTYFIFVRPADAVIANSMGLEAYADDGKLSFSAGRQSMKLERLVKVTTDDYQSAGSTRIYRPFTTATGLPTGKSLAFSIGGTRVYWTSTQVINPQSGALFTDTRRAVRGLRLDGSNNLQTSVAETAVQRFSGRQGNFNYSPNGSMPISSLIVDVTGL